MALSEPKLILITGIMASGKSTVAQLAAERFDRSVHLRGDVFRKMIVNDRVEAKPDGDADGLEQLRLRYRLAAHAADAYVEAGFTVVLQDVVVGPMLNDFLSYVCHRPLHLVVLCPSVEAVEAREAGRGKKGYGIWTPDRLNRVLREETPKLGLWLDSSAWTAEETAERIVEGVRNGEGKII